MGKNDNGNNGVRNWCSSSNEVVNDELQCKYCQSPVGWVRYRLVTAHVVL